MDAAGALQRLAARQEHAPAHSARLCSATGCARRAPQGRRGEGARCEEAPLRGVRSHSLRSAPALEPARQRQSPLAARALASRSGSSSGSEAAPQHGERDEHGGAEAGATARAAEGVSEYVEGAAPEGGGGEGKGEEGGGPAQLLAKAAPLALVAGLALLLGASFTFKDQIRGFIDYFVDLVDGMGPLGYLLYGLVYTALEVLALPAVPLTMTAGAIFGVPAGTVIVSLSATSAATIAFLIARYAARERIQKLAAQSPKFKAIDKVIGRNGLKVVTLLRLSPLLPLALSNYLYGLTSVDLPSYVLGSWLGMLPGTIAYVAAGDYGFALLEEGHGHRAGIPGWQVGAGLAVTALALGYIGRLASSALEEAEREEHANDKPGAGNGASAGK